MVYRLCLLPPRSAVVYVGILISIPSYTEVRIRASNLVPEKLLRFPYVDTPSRKRSAMSSAILTKSFVEVVFDFLSFMLLELMILRPLKLWPSEPGMGSEFDCSLWSLLFTPFVTVCTALIAMSLNRSSGGKPMLDIVVEVEDILCEKLSLRLKVEGPVVDEALCQSEISSAG